MRSILVAITVVALVAWPAAAAEPPTLDAVAFMAGAWGGEDGGTAMEEVWLAPRGGLMLGVHRDVGGGRAVFFEYLRVVEGDGTQTYVASPKGGPATSFRLAELGERRVVFANPEHDFPQRISYWLDAEGRLHARVEGVEAGKPAAAEWVWSRLPGR